ncbi:MAG: glycosyl transferase family 2 [Candidatus Blackburnbacteria bacterium RIFCSPHIGHO2_02_FULL_39_13]|uniref:Glycosyl transferase family 2 n=1 Tax=Candidatus Blackburnbacteria bacterium RIFCSPLOWO2_01_FULL_40_20 TaxID=1797519 RepID=A0A1G1VC76_9BACT|nr:MAG: Glycosyl transferase family 2 [Microgenomates group bacterium GW2011_GWA2_39_19]OGY06866.1 MAG: glycosyl transferase family 2 [Candidatus Blackburnbacteria bacterium RIFCSPHIGHO2_01_FULL_40_17]OGY07967.1 MAG: glycosyl transferase family 2 [Candidatus Blackburnbacteria bacterium RIFCSPHIGHO2_02_FULL_39_13]OGY13024.1 MAG: glycosyl transferase family 2 [Candidatus Blackburnbacteria bacterium RIFCSPLOWO2_01_FULL_40_20]HBL51794.1 glycosyl transferase family 2 [Candidatus Blackburnbacteria ba
MEASKIVIAVMPAYNAAKTIKKTYKDIPSGTVDKVIVVDDGSADETIKVAKSLGLQVFSHPQNRGYGANQKTCYTLALSEGADVVVMIHPDYQYDSTLTGELIRPIVQGRFDVMLGSRIRTREEVLRGGMPLYKYIFNRLLTTIENIVLGQNLSEYHTGFRAFNKQILIKLPFHKYSDDFVFDQQILFGAIARGAKIGEIPVPVRYSKEASSINFQRSLVYGLSILKDLVRLKLLGKRIFAQ